MERTVGPSGETVGDVAYARLRADILFGALAPGERLRLEDAGRRYGASIGTLREILNRLASEGLVLAEGQRGFAVAHASPSEFREVADLRLLLEEHAVALSFGRGDLDWEAGVVAAHHKLSVLEGRMLAGETGHLAELRRRDREFHLALISACASSVLVETYRSIHDRYLRYVTIAAVFRGPASAGEHAALLDCALARDVARAVAVLRTHVGDCVDRALANPAAEWSSAAGNGSPHPITERPRRLRRPARAAAGEAGK